MPQRYEYDRPPKKDFVPPKKDVEPVDFTEFEEVDKEAREFREEEGE